MNADQDNSKLIAKQSVIDNLDELLMTEEKLVVAKQIISEADLAELD